MAMWNVLTVIAVSRSPERSEGEAKQSNEGIFLSHKEWTDGRVD